MWAEFSAIGNLTKDPSEDLKFIDVNGEQVAVCKFRIGCAPAYTKNGEKGESDFYDCVVWRKSAESLAQYMKKGNLIFVKGRPHTRFWEKDGVKHYPTEYTIDTIKFLQSKEGNGNGNGNGRAAAAVVTPPPPVQENVVPF